jgi:hypothetical protein
MRQANAVCNISIAHPRLLWGTTGPSLRILGFVFYAPPPPEPPTLQHRALPSKCNIEIDSNFEIDSNSEIDSNYEIGSNFESGQSGSHTYIGMGEGSGGQIRSHTCASNMEVYLNIYMIYDVNDL